MDLELKYEQDLVYRKHCLPVIPLDLISCKHPALAVSQTRVVLYIGKRMLECPVVAAPHTREVEADNKRDSFSCLNSGDSESCASRRASGLW
jgi:hypothetical protein